MSNRQHPAAVSGQAKILYGFTKIKYNFRLVQYILVL